MWDTSMVTVAKNVGYKYGYRGTHDAVRYLSPYEFVSEWEIHRVTYPSQPQMRFSTAIYNEEAKLNESPYHAKLTASGIDKIKGKVEDLVPGVFTQTPTLTLVLMLTLIVSLTLLTLTLTPNLFVPGIDWCIHSKAGITGERSWVALPESASNLRHEWVMD